MHFGSDTVLSKSPNFINFRLSSANTTDELGSVFVPNTILGRQTNGSNWIPPWHYISEYTTDRVSKMKAKNHYNFKIDFETRREIQDFGRQNDPMSWPTLDSTPLGTNTTNRKMSHIDLMPVRKKLQSLRHWYDQQNCQRKWKSARTRGPGPRAIVVRLIIEEI